MTTNLKNGSAWHGPARLGAKPRAIPEKTDGDYLLNLFTCVMIIGAVFYFWIWPFLKSLIME